MVCTNRNLRKFSVPPILPIMVMCILHISFHSWSLEGELCSALNFNFYIDLLSIIYIIPLLPIFGSHMIRLSSCLCLSDRVNSFSRLNFFSTTDLSTTIRSLNRHIRLNKEAHSDIQWWLQFCAGLHSSH